MRVQRDWVRLVFFDWRGLAPRREGSAEGVNLARGPRALTDAALSAHFRETGGWGRVAGGSEADPTGHGVWGVDRGRGLSRDVSAAVGIGVGRGAGLTGLALVAAQVSQLLDGAEEAAMKPVSKRVRRRMRH